MYEWEAPGHVLISCVLQKMQDQLYIFVWMTTMTALCKWIAFATISICVIVAQNAEYMFRQEDNHTKYKSRLSQYSDFFSLSNAGLKDTASYCGVLWTRTNTLQYSPCRGVLKLYNSKTALLVHCKLKHEIKKN